MSTLVILKFGQGSLTTGFTVTLQIGAEGAQAQTEINGELPSHLGLKQAFATWQQTYRRFDFSGLAVGRPIALGKSATHQHPQVFSSLEECHGTAEQLAHCLNQWLRSPGFLPLRETWLTKLHRENSLRLVIQTQALDLQRLPWHQWDLLQRHPQGAVTFSTPNYDRLTIPVPQDQPVKLLAILGDSQGIDIAQDRNLIESLPDVAATFLVEPDRRQLNDQLWQEPWQVLFFAGHSASLGPNALGRMGINPQDSLTIGELKYALSNAVQRGLKLAIFNSCDGLGLARELADLHIPQLIVMGEPVPDRVAQEFLKHFLTAYTGGMPLHLAVRQARTQLRALEDCFPNASWLPVIFQSLAETPPTWPQLAGRAAQPNRQPDLQSSLQPGIPQGYQPAGLTDSQSEAKARLSNVPDWSRRAVAATLGISTAVGLGVLGIRATGLLQPLELQIYDRLLTLRPSEPPDDRLLVITVTEADLAIQDDRSGGSLSDGALLKLLQTLEPHQPAVIGLDIYRDRPVNQATSALADWLSSDDRFVSVCRMGDDSRSDIAPPPEVSPDRLGFSDLVPDDDGIHRRQLLAMTAAPASTCQTQFSMASALAIRYLGMAHGVLLEPQNDGSWQLGQAAIAPLHAPSGGYQRADTWGYQTLLNYRNPGNPAQVAPQLTLAQVFDGDFDPTQIQNRIVLIGTTAESFKDYSKTPYSQGPEDLAGVLLQAQMTSQLVSAALDGRSLIHTLPLGLEHLWILIGAWLGGGMAIAWPRQGQLLLALGLASATMGLLGFVLLAQAGLWVAVVPVILGLMGSASATRLFQRHQIQHHQPQRHQTQTR